MTARLIPFAGLVVSSWRNGAGRKADIASGPDWLVGFAWLDADVPFSNYGGHDRTILLIEGPGFALDFGPAHAPLAPRRPYVPCSFDGGWVAESRVPDGPCLVLNAMTARSTSIHSVAVTSPAALAAPAPGGAAFVVVLEGSIIIDGQTGGPRDAFRLEGAVTAQAGAGALAALIRIDPVGPRA